MPVRKPRAQLAQRHSSCPTDAQSFSQAAVKSIHPPPGSNDRMGHAPPHPTTPHNLHALGGSTPRKPNIMLRCVPSLFQVVVDMLRHRSKCGRPELDCARVLSFLDAPACACASTCAHAARLLMILMTTDATDDPCRQEHASTSTRPPHPHAPPCAKPSPPNSKM
jgi:hypothetical protein